jgi:hypothetical protein
MGFIATEPKSLLDTRIKDMRKIPSINLVILQLLVVLIPIRWLPGVHPRIIQNTWKSLMIIFILSQTYTQLRKRKLAFPWPLLLIISSIIGLGILAHGFLTDALIVAFGCVTAVYFYQNEHDIKIVYHSFLLWLTILTSYSLLVTFTPIPGFEMTFSLYNGYTSPVERFANPYININSFGFFGERGVYSITSMGFIVSLIYSIYFNSKLYYMSSFVLFAQLITIYWLTGSGRSGFIIPLFFILIVTLKITSTESMIPVVTISPLIIWTGMYSVRDYHIIRPILSGINDFMSNRPSLYFDSIQLLMNNPRSIIGWGPNPWGEYTRAELGVTVTLGDRGKYLVRPHNFLFEFLIQYGILLGTMLFYVCWRISASIVKEVRQPSSPTRFALAIILTSTVFTGILVGGKVGPYPINTPQMILWWMSFGAFVSKIN